MSAFVYLTAPDQSAAYLFADGAGYDTNGVVGNFTQKIACGQVAPIAITAIGHQVLGDKMKDFLVKQADRWGIDEFVDNFLPAFLRETALVYAEHQQHEVQNVAILISAWSETKGGFRLGFQTMDELRDDVTVRAFEPDIDRECTMRGAKMEVMDLVAIARPLAPGETVESYARYFGKAVLSRMREIPGLPMHLKGTDAKPRYQIGGHIDMATVDKVGARIERIHVWDDKVGELIDPTVDHKTVVPFLNRKARRAMRGAA